MTAAVQALLESFDALTESERHEAAAELLRRVAPEAEMPDEARWRRPTRCSASWTPRRRRMPAPSRGEVWLVDLGMVAKSARAWS